MPWMDDAPVPGGESPRGLAGEAWQGMARPGAVWQAWRGLAGSGKVRQGRVWQAW